MKENFPNLVKEIGSQEVQEAQRVPKKVDPRKHTPGHIIIKLLKIKDKERILKASREKETATYEGVPMTLTAHFSRNPAGKQGMERSIQSHERQGPHPRLLYPTKLSFKMEVQIKCFPQKVKLMQFIITKPLFYEMLKGFI